MAPPPRPLPDDLLTDILLRISPDDPASIVRSSAVCKAWRRTLADPAFSGRYRDLHRRTAPVLGFLHNPSDHNAPGFVATAPSFRLPAADRRERHVFDCRHGRVVLYDFDSRSPTDDCFVAWDPITGRQHIFNGGADCYTHAAIVCTAAGGGGCDHRGCGGGPFMVAFAGVEDGDYTIDAHAEFYSSETSSWSMNARCAIALHNNKRCSRLGLDPDRPGVLVGDSFYFVLSSGTLLRYWYTPLLMDDKDRIAAGIYSSDILTLIEPPDVKKLGKVAVTPAEDGGLGLTSLRRNKISLWARETGADGDDGWVRRRVIDLKHLLPLSNPKRRACLSGVNPEDANVIFISTEDGVFTVELETLQARKVSDMANNVKAIYPFVSFYTETLLQKLSGKLPAPVGKH